MKKIISLFTTLCIVLWMFGTFTIFADETADLEISTLAELEQFRDDVNNGNTYEGKTVKLTADIDMSEKYGEGKESWTPIGIDNWDTDTHKPFSGIFDADNYTISGLYSYTDEGFDPATLFSYVEGTIANLNVNGNVIANSQYDSMAAGITYTLGENAQMLNCSFEGTVKSRNYMAGGLVLFGSGLISGCRFKGKVEGMHLVGGIASTSWDTITNCINEGEIIGTMPVGGIAGYSSTITNCINKGSVTGITDVSTYINGNNEEVTESYASERVGGIVGSITIYDTVENCYNTGAISGNSVVGGILGAFENWDYEDENTLGTVKNCYNIGNVTSTLENDEEHYIGGVIGSIVGLDSETINKLGEAINCYYLTGTADKGIAVVGEGGTDTTTALTTEQFADKTNFANWDFDTVWEIDASLGRPVLRSNKEAIVDPTPTPTSTPTATPIATQTATPTATPTPTPTPTASPSPSPSPSPTAMPTPTADYSIKYENGKAVINVLNDGTYTVIFAAYDTGGRLLSVSARDIPLEKGENAVTPLSFTASGADTVKIMLWDSLSGMKPLCDTKTITLSAE